MDKDYSADKEPAVEGTLTADTSSNHYKIIGTWNLTDYSDTTGETFDTYFDGSECYYEDVDPSVAIPDGATAEEVNSLPFIEVLDPDCTPAASAKLVISTFGTYIYMGLAEDESLTEVVMGNWEWGNEEQTLFSVTGGPGDALNQTATLNTITDTQISFTFAGVTYEDESPRDETYSFVKAE